MTRRREHAEAARIAALTGARLVALRATATAHRETGDGADAADGAQDAARAARRALRVTADRTAHLDIVRELAAAFPDDPVLSEEGADDPARLGARRVWIVDPLDGTREYGETGRVDWAVHVALVEEGAVTAAAVALPARDLVLSTCPRPVLPPRGDRSRLRIAVSRTRPPHAAQRVRVALDAQLVAMGSAGAKAMAVVLGEVDAYLHAGGQYEWDSAAPVGVAAAAGLHTSRLDGSPLVYNQPDLWLPDLVICRPELAESLLAAV